MNAHASRARLGLIAALQGALFIARTAAAQAPPAQPVPAQPMALAPSAPDLLALALAPQPGGLTPEEAGKIAAKTKHSVRAKHAELEAAAARVDQAFVNFIPRVSLSATYTHLSPIKAGGLGGAVVGAANNGLLGACPPNPVLPADTVCVKPNINTPASLQSSGFAVANPAPSPVGASAFSFPVILNNYSFVASIAVPVSDYVLRISQGYAAATHAQKGKKLEVQAEELQAASDAKLAYFNWVQARGQVVVAKESVDQAKAHLEDAKKAFAVGLISRADVLRLEAQVAAAQQVEAQVGAFSLITEQQLRIVLSIGDDRALAIGADVLHEQAGPVTETLSGMQETAMQRRLEIRALDETQLSLKETVSIARAGYAPRLDAFADATYANPNQRIFPAKEQFELTWDLGLRLSWTLNDTLTASSATAEAKARVATLAEQKGALRDGLRLEVASAYADLQKAPTTIEAADRQLASAEESLRVRRELFRNGKATSVDLVDAEAEATRARLARLNARIGLLVARVRLEHATGRDVPQAARAD